MKNYLTDLCLLALLALAVGLAWRLAGDAGACVAAAVGVSLGARWR